MFCATRRKLVGMLAILVLAILTVGNSASPTTVMAQATQTATPVAKKSLSEQVGFSDPELAKLESEGTYKLGESLEIAAYGHRYRLLTVLWDYESVAPGGIALLYRMDGAKPILRWSHDYLKDGGYSPFITNIEAPPPGEWNKDGKTFFAVYGGHTGNNWLNSIFYIYEIKPDGTVVSRLKGVIAEGFIVNKIERQPDDQSLLLIARNVQTMTGIALCCGPQILRYYEWRNDKIFNASMNHGSEYGSMLTRAIVNWTKAPVINIEEAPHYAADLLQILMIFDAIEQREAGWDLVQGLVEQARKSSRLSQGTYIDLVFMPTMARLFKENKLFVAPDTANSKYPGRGDFYADDP